MVIRTPIPQDDDVIMQTVTTTYHASGGPFRIVAKAPAPLPGDSVPGCVLR
jgi:hypothetical protein